MSVTFSPTMEANAPHTISCLCGGWSNNVVYPSYSMAYMMVKEVKSECADVYCDYVFAEPVNSEPEVQMSNVNATLILDVLGVNPEADFSDRCTGTLSAEDFLGRVLIAQGVNPSDEGTDSIKTGIMVTFGRPEGYTDMKLSAMRELAEWSIVNGRDIVWG